MRFLAAAAFALLAALPARAEDIRVPFDADYWTIELNWNVRDNSSTVYWTPMDVDGRLAICGIIQHHDASLMQFDRKVLRGSSVKVNGKVVLKGLQFFTAIGAGATLARAEATCKVLDAPIPPRGSEFEAVVPPIRAYD